MFSKAYSLKQKMIEYLCNRQKCLGNIFMFHQVNDDKNKWTDYSCCITHLGFEIFINGMLSAGAVFERLCKNNLDKCHDKAEKRVFITFDDAYEDVYYNCFPLLKSKNIPFTVFIAWDYLNCKGYLTTDMVNEMLKSGLCTIGAHTISHSLLRKMDANCVRYEIFESKKQLEKYFNIQIEMMAYPFGSVYACSKENISIAKEAGYSCAFSTLNSHLTEKMISDGYFIPRRNVNEQNFKKILEKGFA